jgi:phenylacetate-CoA ligase
MRTAGRTADPFSVPWTDFAFVIEDCVRTRLYRWHDIDPRGTLLVVAEDADRPRRELAHWDGAMRALNIPGRRIRIAATLGAEAVADAIRTEQPDVLEIPVAPLREVLARASASGETLPPVETVIAWGAPVDDGLRALCGDVHSARIVETYRMMEVGILGIACPKGAGLHLMADACLAEIVDADGSPCAPGEAGEIVVTPFFNAAMPLIRYCTGDRATRLLACPCGRALPRVTGIRRATIAHEENHAG